MRKKCNGRILHLAINEKFIDHAYISFENVAAGCNDFFVFYEQPIKYIKSTPHKEISFSDRLGFKLYREISQYDLVIVHSLHPFWRSVINGCSSATVFVWIGWGYDYYNILYPDPNKLLLPMTQNLTINSVNSTATKKKTSWKEKIGELLYRLRRLDDDRAKAIKRMTFFSPVLPNEYELVKQAVATSPFPMPCHWNYGSLEEVLLKGFIGKRCNGNNVLLGNSASSTSNHLDWMHWLARVDVLKDRNLICPLSYWDIGYAKQIEKIGSELFTDRFMPLTNFVPLTDYLELIGSCSHLVMNHVRQQGVGNILIMLYLGATVFLREENPCLTYLKQIGFFIYTVQQLEEQPSLLEHRLSEEEVKNNQRLLFDIWSKNTIDEQTRHLIQIAREKGMNFQIKKTPSP